MATGRDNGTISISFDSAQLFRVCVKNDRNVGSLGVFYGDNPFHFVLPATLAQIFLVVVTSRTLYFLLRPIKTPKFICNVIGGILLGPSFLGQNKRYWEALFPPRQAEFLTMMSVTGCAYFLFFVLLKMDVLMTIKAAKSTWRLGVIPFLASFVVISGLLNMFYHPRDSPPINVKMARTALSAVMSFTPFPVISDVLMELNLIATELGQIALSSAMINDNIHWVFIATSRILSLADMRSSLICLAILILFLLFCIFVLRPTMKLIARRTPVGKPVKEIYIVMILLGVLVMGTVSDSLGLTFLLGPLLYGLVIPSGPPLGATVVEKCEAIISEFLLPFFFIAIGMATDLSALKNWGAFITLQCILFAGDLAKLVACVLVSMTYNIKPKHGVVLGFMMSIRGITELIAFSNMRRLKLLDKETFSQLVLCVVVTSAIATPLVTLLYRHRPRLLHGSTIYDERIRTIQSTPRNSEFRILVCVHNEGSVRGITALLEACNPLPESPLCVYAIHLIELLGKSAPILLPINYKENKKSLSVNYPNTNHIMRAFENYSKNSSGPVTVLPYVNVAPYKSMHDAICNLTQDKMVPFFIIPFHENDNIDNSGHVASSIRKLNNNFQARAPCTLGILVDRYSRLGSKHNAMQFFHVGIFFMGGPDDREALALGIRMSERENTRVSLFRFIVMNKKLVGSKNDQPMTREEQKEEEYESVLDESLIDEFKGRKLARENVSWYEIMVDDGVEILDVIRGLEGNYDLVMVGRTHQIESMIDEEMANFIENTQILGIFGDMLSSTEFCIGMVPVLVTQCAGKRVSMLDRVGSVNDSS
ncbi:cation/H(+) antiporter 15-like [Gastrolobium bilobum]|uniref:cation/H(+) antiporter 15-like n=1 Tax=Gastrolobium bilobum TaxID=150636 RepID=UPI002AB19318|nr:cation/H(+) antiporter 15-like [Gastrolobium bilobum]